VLELADVTPGAGVYLGREGGKPSEVIRFVQDRRSGQLGVRLVGADDQWQANVDSPADKPAARSEEHTPELQSPDHLVCRLLPACRARLRDLHPFPTRRSSDLSP